MDSAGYSLYVYDRDPVWTRESRCTGDCAIRFPPLTAATADHRVEDYRPLVRQDGIRQWTYKGHLLYRFTADREPGDTQGDGFDNVWRLARPGMP